MNSNNSPLTGLTERAHAPWVESPQLQAALERAKRAAAMNRENVHDHPVGPIAIGAMILLTMATAAPVAVAVVKVDRIIHTAQENADTAIGLRSELLRD